MVDKPSEAALNAAEEIKNNVFGDAEHLFADTYFDSIVHDIASIIDSEIRKQNGFCVWSTFGFVTSTNCGQLKLYHKLINIKFCMYCGKKIKEEKK